MTSIRMMQTPNGYHFEYDLMQDVRDRLNRKIEIDGEKALELALAEMGYVKERTCKKLPSTTSHTCIVRYEYIEIEFGYWTCSECGAECFEGAKFCMNCGAKAVE